MQVLRPLRWPLTPDGVVVFANQVVDTLCLLRDCLRDGIQAPLEVVSRLGLGIGLFLPDLVELARGVLFKALERLGWRRLD